MHGKSVTSWITHAMTNPILHNKDLLDDMKENFSKGDHFKIYNIFQETHFIK